SAGSRRPSGARLPSDARSLRRRGARAQRVADDRPSVRATLQQHVVAHAGALGGDTSDDERGLVPFDEGVDLDAVGQRAARLRVRIRLAFGGDVLITTQAVAELLAGEIPQQSEVELVPGSLVPDRDV